MLHMISALEHKTKMAMGRAVLLGLAALPSLVWIAGCQDSDLRKVGEDRYVRKEIVQVAGRISEQVDSGEYLLETPVFGEVILRPKFFDTFGLKEGDWVEVEGVWDRPAGSRRPILSEASVRVLGEGS